MLCTVDERHNISYRVCSWVCFAKSPTGRVVSVLNVKDLRTQKSTCFKQLSTAMDINYTRAFVIVCFHTTWWRHQCVTYTNPDLRARLIPRSTPDYTRLITRSTSLERARCSCSWLWPLNKNARRWEGTREEKYLKLALCCMKRSHSLDQRSW